MFKEKTIYFLGFIIALSVAVYLNEDIWSLFIYDREKILSGEVWRLITCNVVHLYPKHLALDIAGIIFVWFLVNKDFTKLYLFSSIIISLSILIFEPKIDIYGGLSGICVSMFVYFCVVRRSFLFLSFILLKICYEYTFLYDNSNIAVIAHISGYFTALFYAISYEKLFNNTDNYNNSNSL